MIITGSYLIELGYEPAKWFKNVVGIDVDQDSVEEFLKAEYDKHIAAIPKTIEPHTTAKTYHKNIKAETVEDELNLGSVIDTMEVLMKTPTVKTGAIMPDACPTGELGQIPVGGIVVTKNAIHPSMHSADICCSVMMTELGDVCPKIVLDAAQKVTHFGAGGRDDHFDLPDELYNKFKNNRFLNTQKILHQAVSQLGTQGDGNHFLYVGKREVSGSTCMVTHHGSRGVGASLYKEGMRVAEKYRQQLSPNTLKRNAWIPYDTEDGHDYWAALQIVREWTKLNHQVLHKATYEALGVTPILNFWNEHNFVFKDGDEFYHAKGATPLDDKFVPDSYKGLRLIPLNMAQPILIVRGDTTEINLGFAPHGAGRNISRTAHKRKFEDLSDSAVFDIETKDIDARFFTGGIDISELPSAYKNAETVQDQMVDFGLGEVYDRIMPYGCIMAGESNIIPAWKIKKDRS